jgi:hypothetical protein
MLVKVHPPEEGLTADAASERVRWLSVVGPLMDAKIGRSVERSRTMRAVKVFFLGRGRIFTTFTCILTRTLTFIVPWV